MESRPKLPVSRSNLTYAGSVTIERVQRAGSRYSFQVVLSELEAEVILKVNYHPNFACKVDGQVARTSRVVPGFLAIDTGSYIGKHDIVCEYAPEYWKKMLFILSSAISSLILAMFLF